MSSTNNLSQELNNLRLEYDTNESVRTTRNREAVIKATDHFLDTLVRSDEAVTQFETNAREAASFGKKLVQLVTWSGRGPTYLNQTLSELLDFGDLCARFQDYFDATYGADEFRVFHYPIRNTRTTALTVSWDKAGFDNADGIIRSNRERAQQRLENRDRGDDNNHTQNHHNHTPNQRQFSPRETERPSHNQNHRAQWQGQGQDQRPRRSEHYDAPGGTDTGAPVPWQPRNPNGGRNVTFRTDDNQQPPRTAMPRRRRPVASAAGGAPAEDV